MIANVGNIQELWNKIKLPLDGMLAEWGVVAIVLLVGIGSFGLGRFSALEDTRPPILIGQAAPLQKPAMLYMGAPYVASRSGSVYYYPWCAGAQKILPANQVWFAGEQEARQAGYRAAKGCKGLAE